jgi:hypothetical protein
VTEFPDYRVPGNNPFSKTSQIRTAEIVDGEPVCPDHGGLDQLSPNSAQCWEDGEMFSIPDMNSGSN